MGAEGLQRLRRRGLNTGRGAEDRTAERMDAKGRRLGQIKDIIVGSVCRFGDLLTNDLLFPHHIGRRKGWTADQVGDDLHGQRQAALEGANLKAGPLIAGGRIDVAAFGLDMFDNVTRRARPCALEHHMFEQMAPARLVLGLVTRPAPDHDRQRESL